jgi:hypothetical protein
LATADPRRRVARHQIDLRLFLFAEESLINGVDIPLRLVDLELGPIFEGGGQGLRQCRARGIDIHRVDRRHRFRPDPVIAIR